MRRLILLAALLAMALVAAIPTAMAQVSQGDLEQETESSDISQEVSVTNTADNASQCVGILQVGQTGTGQNFQGFLQYSVDEGDIEVDESGLVSISPEAADECEQIINQAATAGKGQEKKAKPPVPKTEAKAGPTEVKAAEQKKELPKTGGNGASLFALSVGALLVGGGVLVRRIVR